MGCRGAAQRSGADILKAVLNPYALAVQAVVFVGLSASAAYGYANFKEWQQWEQNATDVPGKGAPAIGGPYTLVTSQGVPITEAQFRGQWTLMYFGFVNCPEICPAEMAKVAKVVDCIDGKYGEGTLQPIFLSIDGDRDSCKHIGHYAQEFSPKFLALTGTPQQIDVAARSWRVYYSIPEQYGSKDDYLLDHSIITYLMNPEGKFCSFFSKEYTALEIQKKVERFMRDYTTAGQQKETAKNK
eukprot:NODE_4246_length_819_cov_13.297688_g4088_i0.p1 GENE.NODE_4246_length_819_cov_13.297688_g4088_i0~~NODE_4246_length_819_cov_13.297688_g4088_i0.p1  ORF type:complete len:258 (+),score=51.03 NODE_4246_length_819_cov_13.297688_g4088_i0:50-775(+)